MLAACGPPDAAFKVRESVEQLHVTHATPGDELVLLDPHGKQVQTGTVDMLGSLIFRHVTAGKGYRVQTKKPVTQSKELTVMSVESSKPAGDFYSKQALHAGFNYLTMRDGTTLSAWVTLPNKSNGPFPTVVNYSGYAASEPEDPNPDFMALCSDFPIVCTPPQDGTALLAGMLGYATVSVNMRGTGCSGGAYDYFETLQLLDGYDIIEIVGAQSWAYQHKVGMVGLSYPGISQLFVASQKPPSLAAIAPMSVIGSTNTTLLPGGMLNDGFALDWVTNVLSKAVPYGQGWEQKQVDKGDMECKENQLLHGQLIDNVAQAREVKFYDPAQHDRYNPSLWVDQIDVPVFLTGQWQDEQTGPYFFLLFDKFKNAPALRMTAVNGVHIDGVSPQVLIEWQTFLELFVAKRVPQDPTKVRNISPLIFQSVFNALESLPASRFSSYGTYEEALAAWKAEQPLRVLFEAGAGDMNDLGAPESTFEHSFGQYPPAETVPTTLYLQPSGALSGTAPADSSSASQFTLDPAAGERGVLAPGGDPWAKLPAYAWEQPNASEAAVFVGDALPADMVTLGTASADLWVNSPVDDADLQVTLSEVRPDGKEVYVQSGWLRASYAKPGPHASVLWPDQTFLEGDWAPLVPGQWTQVRIGTAGFAHVFRAGSKVKFAVDTPGGVRAAWKFKLATFPEAVAYAIGHEAAHPSKMVLPVIGGMTAPTPLPPCPSLRGQPCRDEVPYTNTPK
ncbi:MAG: CocE/NonD family hydrolase [Myxococcaceae bacterium]